MSMFKEFQEFAVKGNVVDMAIGVVIGTAFGRIVTSLVNDIVMPPIGMMTGGADFTDLFITLSGEEFDTLASAQEAGAITINYGVFINTIVNFLIVAFSIFFVIKQMNRLKKKEEKKPAPPPPVPPKEETLLTEIRDLLKKKA